MHDHPVTFPAPVEQDIAPARTGRAVMLLASAVFAALAIGFALTGDGFLEADACTHYVIARWALAEPHQLVSVWGRPFCTALYALPAVLAGRFGVQMTSLTVAIATGLITWSIARRQGYRRPELAGIFLLAMPLVFLHSFSELTELPFALLVALSLWMYQRRQFFWLAVFAALMPLSRPEGFGFLALAAAALALHRRWWWLAVLPIPLIAWNHAGWVLYGSQGRWRDWLGDNWPYADKSMYAAGPLLHFVGLLPVLVSPILFPGLIVGIWQSLRGIFNASFFRRFFGISPEDHRLRVQLVIVAIPLGVLAIHSLLYWTGRMASNGELRYLLVAAPMWALLGALGWEWVFARMQWPSPVKWASAGALVPLLVNFTVCQVLPLQTYEDWQISAALAEWYQKQSDLPATHPRLMASHGAIYYYADISMHDRERAWPWGQSTVRDKPPGTLLIWDPVYGLYNADARMSVTIDQIRQAGWREIPWPLDAPPPRRAWSEINHLNSPPPGDTWRLFVSDPVGG